jgi:hypothetical protein
MGFNVGNFIKDSAKSILGSAVDNIIGNVVSNLATNSRLPAQNIAESMFNIGASYQSISSFAATKTDAIIAGEGGEYYALSGKDPNRTGQAKLSDLRNTSITDASTYNQKVNPESAIQLAKNNRNIEVMMALG